MRAHEVARRYADALYQAAADAGTAVITATEDELRGVVDTVSENPEVGRFLAHPLISRERKAGLVNATFPELSELTRNMLMLLIRNRRETYLDLTYDEFLGVRVEAEGLAQVTVVAARPLDNAQRDGLKKRLEEAIRRPVQLSERTDERLLGGARIEMDGRVIDGTLRARLGRLRALLGE